MAPRTTHKPPTFREEIQDELRQLYTKAVKRILTDSTLFQADRK